MDELTIEEARRIYTGSNMFKDDMLAKFSKEELEKNTVSQEEFDNTFMKFFYECPKTVFLDAYGFERKFPTNRIKLLNSADEWLFDIQFTGESKTHCVAGVNITVEPKHFWVSSERVFSLLKQKYPVHDVDLQLLIKNTIDSLSLFGKSDIMPSIMEY